MKRQRRKFEIEFKTEVVKRILQDVKAKNEISKERSISIPLLDRWVNDYIAQNKRIAIVSQSDRRKDYQTVQELKAKIADLYMQLERSNRYSIRAQDSR